MRSTLLVLTFLLEAQPAMPATSTPPEPASSASADAGAMPLEEETQAWHRRRLERLTAEDGWLSLVGLHWLHEGENVAGSKEGARVRLPASAPPVLGSFRRQGFTVHFTPAEGGKVTVEGKPFPGGVIQTDETGAPDVLRSGTLQLLAIRRGDQVGIRVRDSQASTRLHFTGIARYAVSSEWRKDARWEPAKAGEALQVPNVLGKVESQPLAGTAIFTHRGKELRLVAVQEDESLFFVFADLTNRDETYGAGRFLYAELPTDGRVMLDFNRAYNPPCAFTAYATCPLPTRQNRLPVRVEAGEKRVAHHP